MARICAFLRNNVVQIVKSVEDAEYHQTMKTHDLGIDVEDLAVQPQVGWLLAGGRLVSPYANPTEIVMAKVQGYKKFSSNVMDEFIVENIVLGITQQGKTRLVGETMKDLTYWLERCSMNEALAEIENIKSRITPEMAPFITEARMNVFRDKILVFLGLK